MESTSGPAPGGEEAREGPAPGAPAPEPPPQGAPYEPPPQGASYAPPPQGAQYAPPPPGGQVAYAPAGPVSIESARNTAMLAHISALVGLIGIPSLIGPLIVWLSKREEHPFIDDQGKEALNFNLSLLIYGVSLGIVSLILLVVTLGLALIIIIPAVIAFGIGALVLVIVAAVKSSRGEQYRYPLTIRMVR